jgi:phage replication initiation protein
MQNQALRNTPQRDERKKQAVPPISNTGGKHSHNIDLETELTRAKERVGLIDYLTVTIPDQAFKPVATDHYDHDEFIGYVNWALLSDLNLQALEPLRGGKNFYANSWDIVDSSFNIVGFVAHGGNNDTLCINITGSGCAVIGTAGYLALYRFLQEHKGKITRVDIAHDFFDGRYSVDTAINWYKEGLFVTESGRGKKAQAKLVDDFGLGTGRTLYVGSRKSGKLFRAYEKGKQLGDSENPWVRFELELRSVDRVIPLEIIFEHASFLAGAYICLKGFDADQSYIKTQQKTTEVSFKHLEKYCRMAYGRFLNVMRYVYETDESIIESLKRDDEPPRRLKHIESAILN